jgi:hypothetical protein
VETTKDDDLGFFEIMLDFEIFTLEMKATVGKQFTIFPNPHFPEKKQKTESQT